MSLISLNIKQKIIDDLNNILNFQDSMWTNLDTDIKFKIIHNLCKSLSLKNNVNLETNIKIPLKNLRPKKIVQFVGINKLNNSVIYDDYRKKFISINNNFRKNYNSSNKNYCFANLSKNDYNNILNNFNYNFYIFLTSNINNIDCELFYYNLIGKNHEKNSSSTNILKIKQINYKEKFLSIEFNNNMIFELELYLTSEKITNNIPAKYNINLINIF